MNRTLDEALLAAHDREDGPALIQLYEQAANEAGDEQASGFFLTHAYVFALECGDARADTLRRRLAKMGRETLT
ncbi:hypothetical protein [Marivita geojedonensis]|uniref:Uncharacterized protein n=1 Tax=Marivita geojedonensis TaxID=1123756 RepID=A0A1X4NNP3_9RHOB|nr:hypothetical protein [Marivita geojedonensis]OSQ52108.1 hypothetical protein MGEO_06210 [Marivita geojedonensis]PRY81116.1 hypothetical protein CLV76_10273 [Marivita geojedonensis]